MVGEGHRFLGDIMSAIAIKSQRENKKDLRELACIGR